MAEITWGLVARVGVELSKRVYQVHAVDRSGRVLMAKSLSRKRFLAWCAELPAGCLVAMETCGGAHHPARRLRLLGLDARLIAGHFVTPYRMASRGGNNDANDAAAICEAACRPHMRFVPVKTAEQQGQLSVHRLREGYKAERTALINRIRGVLAEFGLVYPQSPEALRRVLAEVLEDAGNELTGIARLGLVLQRARLHWIDLELQMKWSDERIEAHARSDERAAKAAALQGIGPIGASALVASVGDFRQFSSAKQFGAWLGLVPSQNSTGGKARLGRITKRGDDYLRTLLIQGAKSAVMTAAKRSDRISLWLVQLKERVGWKKTVMALGNKNARIPVGRADPGWPIRSEPCSLGTGAALRIEPAAGALNDSFPPADAKRRWHHRLSPDMVRPEDGPCLAKGPASGRPRPARQTGGSQTR